MIDQSVLASIAPPVVASGHGEWQRHRGESRDLPVERTREEELVEDHHGDRLAEDHTDSHNLWREKWLEPSGDQTQQTVQLVSTWTFGMVNSTIPDKELVGVHVRTFSLWCWLKMTDVRKRMGWQRNHRKHPWKRHNEDCTHEHFTSNRGQGCINVGSVLVRGAAYFGEAEVEVPLQSAPFSGDDLVKDRGQQKGQQDSERHEEESSQTLLWVVAVMFTLRLGILLP